ncbi:MAG: 2-succinyl-5-enolpyruvyl-6-hydroxy-3-cyclohexene-1-carboxylic-acid synthase [Bacteroidota bacterium]
MLHSSVFNLSVLCHQLGVNHAVLSPGSRNAPITISFARHSSIKKYMIPDERSAGFIALGIAQEANEPVVLCCTSGTALLNYGPAVAEAYYRQIPLLVLSADRPPHLIDQRDGQTIRQFEALKNHVKQSYKVPIVKGEPEASSFSHQIIEAFYTALSEPKGPVHINIPFDEPFYPQEDQQLNFEEHIALKIHATPEEIDYDAIRQTIQNCGTSAVLVGQTIPDENLQEKLSILSGEVPVLGGPLSNVHCSIQHVDGFISANKTQLCPDLLITTGLSILSKNLKGFLRANKPLVHIHCDPAEVEIDTFQTNPILVKAQVSDLLDNIELPTDPTYLAQWNQEEKAASDKLNNFKGAYSEVAAYKRIHEAIPEDTCLHLSNSMPVRYADLFGKSAKAQVFSNRGTSGIDGCTSTALGTSLISQKQNLLITGELAFLYDRNAFFNQLDVSNLKIIVLNNKGGGIFRLIPGPSKQPELEDYFETRHNFDCRHLCGEHDIRYFSATDFESLDKSLDGFFELENTSALLEVFTDPVNNQKVYQQLKEELNA